MLRTLVQDDNSLILYLFQFRIKDAILCERVFEERVAIGRVISPTDHHVKFLLFIIAENTQLFNDIVLLFFLVSHAVLQCVVLVGISLYELGVLVAVLIVSIYKEVLNEVGTAVVSGLVE